MPTHTSSRHFFSCKETIPASLAVLKKTATKNENGIKLIRKSQKKTNIKEKSAWDKNYNIRIAEEH